MVLLLRPTSLAAACLSTSGYTVYPILKAVGFQLHPEMEETLVKLVALLYLGI